MNSPLVSLALIAGPGEGAILRRLIESARGLWDEVCVVAATGSQPYDDLEAAVRETAGPAGKFAVYKNAPENSGWPHIDNFAAARNQAFAMATGKYVLWADCDDLFEGQQPALHRNVIAERDKAAEGWEILVTRYDVQNSGMRDNRRERIFRRQPDGTLPALWERAIHERVKPIEGKAVGMADGLVIVHAPNTDKRGSSERNKRILAATLEGAGMSWYYVAMEDFLRGNYKAAIGPCLLALEHPDVGLTERYQLLCMAGVMCADHVRKRKYLGKAITISPTRKEAYGHLACVFMDEGNFPEAVRLFQIIESMPRPQGVIWNLDAKWYGHLPKMLLEQCLRGVGQTADADRCLRESFRQAWGQITVIHAGALPDVLRSSKLFTDTADNPSGVQHIFITDPGQEPAAKRIDIAKDAAAAVEKALGHRLLFVEAKADTPLPPLRWDIPLTADGVVPAPARQLPSPVERKGHVKVCLTTTPKRIHTILPTLESLLQQSRPADEIVLSIPEKLARTGERFGDIPAAIQALADEGKITIHRCHDHGPATKFVGGAHHAEPDDFIIWCDDDILYSPKMVETLVASCPEGAAIGVSGFVLTPGYTLVTEHHHEAEILEGFGGVCCRKKDLPDLSLWPSYTAKEFAKLDDRQRAEFLADDFMMSKRLREKGTRTLICACPELYRVNALKIRPEGLGEDALQNNKQTGGNLAAYALLKSGR